MNGQDQGLFYIALSEHLLLCVVSDSVLRLIMCQLNIHIHVVLVLYDTCFS